MKIYVVTGYKGHNYGTKLQSTALCKYFEKLGFHVEIVERFWVKSFFISHPVLFLNRVKNKLNQKKQSLFFEPVKYEISETRKRCLELYERENYNVCNINSSAMWQAIIAEECRFVIGSDIIWQPNLGVPTSFFADYAFYTGIKVFSYATSLGATEIPHKLVKWYKKYLSSYTAISVREKQSADLLNSLTGLRIENVVDPTLLFDNKFWSEFGDHATIKKSCKYVLAYFVMEDERYWKYVERIVKKTGLSVVVMPMHRLDEINHDYDVVENGTPYDFVWLIEHAELICTDSFHACAFSLNFEKEFYLMRRVRKDEDAKYDDFLNRYGLQARCVTDESIFERRSINYNQSSNILCQDRLKSQEFIKRSIMK